MHLKNQAFVRQNELDHRRKLRVVLRQLTADHLTPEQRVAIEQAVGHQRQYRLHLCPTRQLFHRMTGKDSGRNTITKTLFGSLDDPPTAMLVRYIGASRAENMIYIYLPDKKEEE